MKQIYQYRYYGNDKTNSKYNQPANITAAKLISGTIFTEGSPSKLPIVQLGIQALPGTKFYLNNSADPIIIGSTGIYELNVDGQAYINSISFDSGSINMINSGDILNAYLLVDIIYESSED